MTNITSPLFLRAALCRTSSVGRALDTFSTQLHADATRDNGVIMSNCSLVISFLSEALSIRAERNAPRCDRSRSSMIVYTAEALTFCAGTVVTTAQSLRELTHCSAPIAAGAQCAANEGPPAQMEPSLAAGALVRARAKWAANDYVSKWDACLAKSVNNCLNNI